MRSKSLLLGLTTFALVVGSEDLFAQFAPSPRAALAPPASAPLPNARNGPFVGAASWILEGEETNAWVGNSVCGIGDVNGDGLEDVAVGSTGLGEVFVFHGSTNGLGIAPDWTATGPTPGVTVTALGASVAGGDFNGDGFADLLVSSRFHDNGSGMARGRVYLFTGSPAGLSASSVWDVGPGAIPMFGNTYVEFGWSIDSAGDVNGDGYDDVLIGEHIHGNGNGRVWLYLGSSTGPSTTPAWTQIGERSGFYLGSSVAGAGDLNGDGYDDVVLGEYGFDPNWLYDTNHGRAQVYFGSATGLGATADRTLVAPNVQTWFGWSVAGVGDVNGDGFDDVFVGGYNLGLYAGRVSLYYGGPSGPASDASWSLRGSRLSQLGYRVAGAGDLDRDGFADLAFAAPLLGQVRVYRGSPLGPRAADVLSTPKVGVYGTYGRGLAAAGDVDGDGFPELVVSSPQQNFDGLSNAGRVTLHRGLPGGQAFSADAELADLSSGGTAGLRLSAGAPRAGRAYVVLGSASGTSPGYLAGGIRVPLNLDAYTSLTLTPDPMFTAFAGVLDGDGRAEASVSVPAGSDPGLAGTTLHHAFLVFGSTGRVTFASNPVPLRLFP